MAIYLNLGSGKRNREGYINIDAIQHTPETVVGDILKLQIEDGSVDAVFSEHVLEHLTKNELELFFHTANRVLKTGGELEIIVPCLKTWINRYVKGEIDIDILENFLYGPQLHPYDFHKQGMYDDKLKKICTIYGFEIKELKYQDRPHSNWEIYLKAVKI
jgi:predicted SAM-dependent methyltransferase